MSAKNGCSLVLFAALALAGCGGNPTTTVTPPPPQVTITMNPSGTLTVTPSGTLTFNASVSGSSNTAVNWTATVGTVAAGANGAEIYTAPSTAATATLKAVAAADSSVVATATINVAPVGVTATASASAITPTQSVTLSAPVTGSSNTDVTWSVSSNADPTKQIAGTLNGNVYTAPGWVRAPYTVIATATSAADPTKSATASFTVNPVAVATTITTVNPDTTGTPTAVSVDPSGDPIWVGQRVIAAAGNQNVFVAYKYDAGLANKLATYTADGPSSPNNAANDPSTGNEYVVGSLTSGGTTVPAVWGLSDQLTNLWTGGVATCPQGGQAEGVAVGNGIVYVGIQPADGSSTMVTTMDPRTGNIDCTGGVVVGPQGYIIHSMSFSSTVGRLTVSGDYPITTTGSQCEVFGYTGLVVHIPVTGTSFGTPDWSDDLGAAAGGIYPGIVSSYLTVEVNETGNDTVYGIGSYGPCSAGSVKEEFLTQKYLGGARTWPTLQLDDADGGNAGAQGVAPTAIVPAYGGGFVAAGEATPPGTVSALVVLGYDSADVSSITAQHVSLATSANGIPSSANVGVGGAGLGLDGSLYVATILRSTGQPVFARVALPASPVASTPQQ